MFSKRSPTDLEPTPWARLLGDLQARRVPLVDLTLSNPTQANIEYPADLLAPLAGEAALRYEPSPLGLPAAREAISSEYARRGVQVPPDQILLTASTSEAYSFLFKLLCDPGDEVLVPVPSYPLFEHLTRLDAVRPVPYPLEYHGRWSVDVPAVARAISARARGLLLVSPNNPTGSFVSEGELGALADLCASRDLAIVGDEVFADYVFDGASGGPSVLSQDRALAFALGGLSKSIALPQVKLGWVAVAGPEPLVRASLERLEHICDTYLSVSTPVQLAVPDLLARGAACRAQVARRIAVNRRRLVESVGSAPAVDLLHAEGGWYAVLRVPSILGEEQLALELLREDHVLVHPGYFFDFSHEAFVVLSLLPAPETFAEGVARLLARVTSR